SGKYTIIAFRGSSNCQATMNGSATIKPLPLAFNVSPAGIICAPAIIGLDGSETGVEYKLYKDDLTTGITIAGTGNPISFGLQAPGDYTIEAIDLVSRCSLFMTSAVPAGLQFDFSATESCIGGLTYFTPQLISPAGNVLSSFMWNFGDPASGLANTSTLGEPSHKYSQPGTYIVTLELKDINQCISTKYGQAVVSALPKPEFSYLGGNCDSTLSFTNLTNTNDIRISKWIWQFGDGKSDTIMSPASPNVTHVYPHVGVFYMTFSVFNENGCMASISDTVRLFPCVLPEFRSTDTLICQYKAITFTDKTLSDGPIAKWYWDFGDNSTMTYSSQKSDITHIFESPGTFTVKLVTTTQMVGGMKSDSITHPVTVNPSPLAKYTVQQDVCMGIPVKFTNSTITNGTQITGYSWMFGDPGTLADTSSLKHATYLYTQSGDFDAALVAKNTLGCSNIISHTLTVHPLPGADFQYSVSCAGVQTHFTDSSETVNATVQAWKWDFLDSTSIIGRSGITNPDFLFASEGNFKTRLTITDNNGCQDTVLKQVVIHPVPVNAFEIKEDYDNVQGQIQLSNGTINATGYEWDFGNGSTSTADEPIISYDRDGYYKIKLISYNDFHCSDTLEMFYKLMFKGLYVPNAFSPGNPISGNLLFKPVGMNLKTYRVEVYDSWGNLLWSSTVLDEMGSPVESWDGTFKGNLLPQDVYIWKIKAVFNDGTIWDSNEAGDHTNLPNKTFGTVTLLR
ncbi:MAG TPA: PKD domain-containing protein, partial [Bacteroidales bacterium]